MGIDAFAMVADDAFDWFDWLGDARSGLGRERFSGADWWGLGGVFGRHRGEAEPWDFQDSPDDSDTSPSTNDAALAEPSATELDPPEEEFDDYFLVFGGSYNDGGRLYELMGPFLE